MMRLDPYLIVRVAAVYLTTLTIAVLWVWRRPSPRLVAGAMLASAWNVPAILGLHLLALRLHWWHFDAHGGLFLGMPVDLYLSWVCLWGVIPALAFPSAPLVLVAAAIAAIDLVLMPAGEPAIQLGPGWMLGEAVGLAIGLVPGQLLARWTAREDHLPARASLQAIAFTGVLLFVLPAIAIDASATTWINPATRPAWQISLMVQALCIVGLLGLTAVQEFAERGGGTPVPFDPPGRLVTTGIYSFVRNPMQLCAVLLLLLLGALLANWWVAAAALVAHIYSAGLAGWDEEEDLRRRFGPAWIAYQTHMRSWLPRFRPWLSSTESQARLYVSEECSMCSDVARWFESRGVRDLAIIPAERYVGAPLSRITYESGDGRYRARGIAAIARALEHLHLGWAMVGFLFRLPVVGGFVQLLADASGAGPRRLQAGSVPHNFGEPEHPRAQSNTGAAQRVHVHRDSNPAVLKE